jgi:hypothetical protein
MFILSLMKTDQFLLLAKGRTLHVKSSHSFSDRCVERDEVVLPTWNKTTLLHVELH